MRHTYCLADTASERVLKMNTIDVAKDFSANPAGRFKTDGPFSGEKFREEFLVPALKRSEATKILLDGTRGYGSSFLDEAFAGLVRVHGFQPDELSSKLILETSRLTLKREIEAYIQEAFEHRQ